VIVRIANQERELRTLVGEHSEARAVGRIRNRPSVDDVRDDGAVHESIEAVATGIVESKIIQGVDLAGNEQQMVKQPLRQLQRRDAGTGVLSLWKRHVEIGEGKHAVDVVHVIAVPGFDVRRDRKTWPETGLAAINVDVVIQLASVIEIPLLAAVGLRTPHQSPVSVDRLRIVPSVPATGAESSSSPYTRALPGLTARAAITMIITVP